MTKKYIILAPTDRRTDRCVGDYTLPLYSYQKMSLNTWDWVIVFDSLDEAKHFLYPVDGSKACMDEMDKWKMTCCIAECEVADEGGKQQVKQVTRLHYINWLQKQREMLPGKRAREVMKADWHVRMVQEKNVSAELLDLLTRQLQKMKTPVVVQDAEDENDASFIGFAAGSVWSLLSGVYMFVDAIAATRHVPMISPVMAVLRWWWHRQAEPAAALVLPEPQQKVTAAPQCLFSGNPKRQTKEAPNIKRDAITLTHF